MTDETTLPPAPSAAPIPLDRAAPLTAWLLYALIVLEILFMVSPAAAYYYAVYAAPLNGLADLPATAWLTLHVLPHFAYSDSALVNGLIAVSWPLIGIGTLLFLVGFVQIYGARLRQARGAPATEVASGLYRYIRHPQYLALAVVGLGTALFWSRFLVWIAFVLMLCLYSALARLEERRCLRRFGDSYRRYMTRTGRFLPRPLEDQLAAIAHRGRPDRASGPGRRLAMGTMVALLSVGASVVAGGWLRDHAVASLQVARQGPHTLLFLAPLGAEQRARTAELLAPRLGAEGRLVYLAPPGWTVPELGLSGAADNGPGNLQELAHPGSHGNRGGYGNTLLALITRPTLLQPAAPGAGLLAATVRIEPLRQLDLSLDSGAVSAPTPAGPGRWAGIPVPVY
ncbi:MAG: isoprenylcysteine carboxylmethyltransferase family protein [Pseudomonadales bacterium]